MEYDLILNILLGITVVFIISLYITTIIVLLICSCQEYISEHVCNFNIDDDDYDCICDCDSSEDIVKMN